jgi:ribosomal protein L11 methyltransferase
MKLYPALDVCTASPDTVLALVDDFSPTALEEHDAAVRLFFTSPDGRDAACAELRARGFETAPLEVSDEDWARRSQESLEPVTVGRITIIANAGLKSCAPPATSHQPPITIVISPSMGFGTGHHATTRLCLALLQQLDMNNASLLDVGTGSGILAIAGRQLGARTALGLDVDPDAVQAARENLEHNRDVDHVQFELADINRRALPHVDVLTANLTGTLLARSASLLQDAARGDGSLVLSGIFADERSSVVRAFDRCALVAEQHEAEWVGLLMKTS